MTPNKVTDGLGKEGSSSQTPDGQMPAEDGTASFSFTGRCNNGSFASLVSPIEAKKAVLVGIGRF